MTRKLCNKLLQLPLSYRTTFAALLLKTTNKPLESSILNIYIYIIYIYKYIIDTMKGGWRSLYIYIQYIIHIMKGGWFKKNTGQLAGPTRRE